MRDYPLFISTGAGRCEYDKHISAPILRKTFIVGKDYNELKILISGLGFYRLFVNGKEITKGFLAPYISNTDDIVYFDEYDVTDLIHKGKNSIAAILGNGMQNCVGGGVWDFHLAKFRSAPKLAVRLTGDNEIIGETDESWKWANSSIFFDDLRCGCFCDGRDEIKGWADVDFDDSQWNGAVFAEKNRGECRICEAEPITVQKVLKPVGIYKNILPYNKSEFDTRLSDAEKTPLLPNGLEHQTITGDEEGYLYDFGENTTGVWRLKINGEKGQKIILQAVEFLEKDGTVQVDNFGKFFPTGYAQRDVYICSGEGEEIFIPSFTYHGARYCFVIGITEEQATEELVTYLVLNSDLEERGGFNCSDEIANKVNEACIRSAKSNFFYFPTDCPHREKNGWTGDAAASAEYMTMNFATEKSFSEWERNICKALTVNGDLPGIVPTSGWGYYNFGPAWDRVIVYVPYYTYLYRGDKKIIEENAYGIIRYLNNLEQSANENGLYDFGLGDWCPPGREADRYLSPVILTSSVMALSICEKAAYLFGEIGMDLQKSFALGLYKKIKKAIRENLIDFSTMTAIGSSQTSQAICIFYDVFESGEKNQAFHMLMKFIEEKDGHCDCGYIGSRVIYHVLAMFGEYELAYKMINRPDFPSMAYPIIELDSTTLWETNKIEKNNSENHHFFGDVSNFFIKRIAGLEINPFRRNVNEFVVHPGFVSTLKNASAFYNSTAGKIEVEWKRKNELIYLCVVAPDGTRGSLNLPLGYEIQSDDLRTSGLRIINLNNGKNEIIIKKI